MIRRQTYLCWHCILVDDCSTDNSFSILTNATAGDHRFQVLSNSHPSSSLGRGPGAARNIAINASFTPYLAFCDIDDLWHPLKLEYQMTFHCSNSLDISVTSYVRFTSLDSPYSVSSILCPPPTLSYKKLLQSNPLPLLTVVVRRNLLLQGFPSCKHEDYALWLNIFRANKLIRYGCLPLLLSYYRLHESNITRKKWMMPLWAFVVYRQHGMSVPRSITHILFWSLSQLRTRISSSLRSPVSISVNDLTELPPLRR